MSKLTLIRGIPGSGKSTLAKCLPHTRHLEADMFFLDDEGNYNFNPRLLKGAHVWCQLETADALKVKDCQVIVSNTFTQLWEIEPYINLALEHNVRVQIVTCTGKYKSIHNVPEEAIQRLTERFTPTTTLIESLGTKNIDYFIHTKKGQYRPVF